MRTLLVNGCSHAAGSECNTNFSQQIAEQYPHAVVNIAHPGGSNHRIMRTTIEHIENSNTCPDFVLIAWTTHERFEFSFENELSDYTLAKQSDNSNLEKFYRYADLYLADWNVGLEFTLTYQHALQTYLKHKQIPYLFCNMFNSIPVDCQKPLWQSIDQSKYYKPHCGLIEDYLQRYPHMFSETKHAVDPFIHRQIAQELTNTNTWKQYV